MMRNKSTLAKLLSEEDINVVYKQMETAYFNSKTRELGLPIWKDEEMTNSEHDLMLGHEVGHALWTPLDMLEAAQVRGINHSFVNIIEDARIEKFAKRKYPGLVGVFKRGYTDLIAKDFFGTKERNIGTFGLIDRINVFYKTGDIAIPFSDDERPLMEKVATVETEEDVLSLAEEIFKFMDENPESNAEENADDGAMGNPVDGNGMSAPTDGSGADAGEKSAGEDGAGEKGGTGKSEEELAKEFADAMKSGDKDAMAKAFADFEDGLNKEEGKENGNAAGDDTDGDDSDGDDADAKSDASSTEGGVGKSSGASVPMAETDDIGKKVLEGLRDTNAKDRNYGNIPKIDSDKFIIGYKDVLEEVDKHYNKCREDDSQDGLFYTKCVEEVETVKKENKKTVAYMVKEFEMKKSADAYARAATAKTGSLDMGKLHTYKYNEDLFKKVTVLPGATNHGMVMIVDWSGSMHDNLKGTIIQTMNLVWFCRRAKIPFPVLAFSDAYANRSYSRYSYDREIEKVKIQNFKAGDLVLKDFRLLEFFSSNMTLAEETRMMTNIFMMMNRYGEYRDWSVLGYPYEVAPLLNMGGTPLNDAIIVTMDLVEKFKVDAGVQKIHTIFLTDGASNRIEGKYDTVFDKNTDKHADTTVPFGGYGSYREDTIITDPVTNKKYTVTGDMTNTLLRALKGRIDGMNVIGFFLAGTGKSGRVDKRTLSWVTGLTTWDDEMKSILRKINKEKFYTVEGDITGYDEYYILGGGKSLTTENETLSDDLVGAGKGKLKSAFGKMQKGKITSRVLLNRFIKLVA